MLRLYTYINIIVPFDLARIRMVLNAFKHTLNTPQCAILSEPRHICGVPSDSAYIHELSSDSIHSCEVLSDPTHICEIFSDLTHISDISS